MAFRGPASNLAQHWGGGGPRPGVGHDSRIDDDDGKTGFGGVVLIWADDTRAIVQELGKLGVSYEVRESGNVIKVPAEHVHELRCNSASLGLPDRRGWVAGGFDRTHHGATVCNK